MSLNNQQTDRQKPIRVGFSTVLTAYYTSCCGRGVTPHPFYCRGQRKGKAIPLLPLWAVRPVPSLSACTRVHFNFVYTSCCKCLQRTRYF